MHLENVLELTGCSGAGCDGVKSNAKGGWLDSGTRTICN